VVASMVGRDARAFTVVVRRWRQSCRLELTVTAPAASVLAFP